MTVEVAHWQLDGQARRDTERKEQTSAGTGIDLALMDTTLTRIKTNRSWGFALRKLAVAGSYQY